MPIRKMDPAKSDWSFSYVKRNILEGPDWQNNLALILKDYMNFGLVPIQIFWKRLTEKQLRRFYKNIAGKPYCDNVINYGKGGDCLVIVLENRNG